jgi:hypothetical protein
MLISEERLEAYAEEYLETPAYSRKKQMFTFDMYLMSREAGFTKEVIIKWMVS